MMFHEKMFAVCQSWQQEEASTMNQPVPEELISAYFDGEVSPDERGAVERLLESSSELRQQLDETSKLSALLHSFPRESAPRELAANVQKQVNAAAQPPVATAQNAVPATTRRSLSREWTAFGAGMLATIASLLMFVTFNRPPFITNSPTPVQMADEYRPLVVSKHVDQESLAEADPTLANERFATDSSPLAEQLSDNPGIPKNTRLSRSKTDDLAAQTDPSAKLNEEERLSQNPAPMVANYDSVGINSNSIQPQTQHEFLSNLANGDVIVSKVADPSNTVAVVDFTVVDIERGSNELKIVLLKRSLQQVDSGEDAWSVKQVDSEDRPEDQPLTSVKTESKKKGDSARPDEFQVFFVRAPGDQLAETIGDLIKKHPDIYRNWTPQPPIELPVAMQTATEGQLAENQAPIAAQNKFQDDDLKRSTDETATVNAEAEMAVGVLMARNGSVNPNGDFNFNGNTVAPLSMSDSIIGNSDRKLKFGPPAAAPIAPNPKITETDNNLRGNNTQISGNSGQGYFRVSRQNLPHVALQQATPDRNKGAPLVASSPLNTNLDTSGGLGGGMGSMGRNSMMNTSNDSRNPRLVRMLFVLKSGQATTNPGP
jgi:hypothetical protein